MSPQAMTHLPLYRDDQNRIIYPKLDQKSSKSSTLPSNTDGFLRSYQLHHHSSGPERHATPSPSHDVQDSGSNPRLSRLSSVEPTSFSSSTIESAPNTKVLHDRGFPPSQPTFPAAAFILASDAPPASMSDNRRLSWQEQREWTQAKNNMALGALTMDPPSQRPRAHVSMADMEHDDDYVDDDETVSLSDHENAFYILIRLSFIVPPYSLFVALYTFFVILFLVFATPLRLCPPTAFFKPSSTFSMQICHILLPLHRVHQRFISTPSPSQRRRDRHPYHQAESRSSSHAHSGHGSPENPPYDNLETNPYTTSPYSPSCNSHYSIPWLILIHLLSPLLIVPVLFAAWITAFFWIFTMIMGNPDGTERRDDGRAAVLGVRNWWKIWLSKARRRKKRERNVARSRNRSVV
ncbi:hypothetical protein D8B26_000214 [Coccidioides posadasii str. Silveira]|uniref:Uncharacterized protein n=1 Tax=Coccidioides posadasii (strain RMSCC 757 / Silveira) TaxID=443226 RepID=E9D7Z7_COCPS|nr:conserved hypothetical protein [Coccidioides posadasii str. Silveira]QVM05507.1 hypothetical protein D8B26_000214 [Coccidioides posadasii str. Silveira]